MSDTELREAAERLVKWSRTMVLGRDTFTSLTRMAETADAVATRLLELLPPADDATPVTADWLKAVGFVLEDGVFIREQDIGYDCHVVGLMTENATEWDLYDSFGSGENKVSAFALPTRGHVRRLCQAIGINLTESK